MVDSNKIKGRIVELGLNQSDVARYVGLATTTTCQKINNVRSMKVEEAAKMATLLKIPDEDFSTYFFK